MNGREFWIVWNPDSSRAPRVRHACESAAIHEAERLAMENHGYEFVVLKAVTGRRVKSMVTIDYNVEAVEPF